MQQYAEHMREEPPGRKDINRAPTPWKGLLITGLALLFLGLLATIAPLVTSITFTIFFGAVLVLAGVAEVIYAFIERGEHHFLGTLLTGALSTLVGLALLAAPAAGAASITLLLSALFIAGGILRLIIAFLRPVSFSRGWLFANGLIMIVLGAVILSGWPQGSVYALGVLIGVGLFFTGLSQTLFALALRRWSRGIRF